MKKNIDDCFIGLRCSSVDKKLAIDMADAVCVSESDLIKMAIWEYATSSKNTLIRQSLRQLAQQRKKNFEIDVLKELEYINNKQAFFIDGFKTALENYSKKHVKIY